jgi:LysW-gamma-L-lysine carboxypeptidase
LTDGQALELLQEAVAIPSPSGSEAAVAHRLVQRMDTFCDSAFVDAAGNAVGIIGSGPLGLTCLGHIDTVPGLIPVRIENGELWGRGSVDAKGPFCSALAGVARAFARDPSLRERLSVHLIGAVGEETAGSAGARFAVTAYPAPDFVLICEPSGQHAITLGYKGRLAAEFSVQRPEFHSAGQGSTAAEVLLAAWLQVQELAAQHDAETGATRVFDAVQASLLAVHSSSDGLQQKAVGSTALRLPVSLPAAQAAAALEAVAARVTAWLQLQPGAAGASCSVCFSGGEDAVLNARDSAFSRAWRLAIRQQGGQPRFKVKTGTSDMNVVAASWTAPQLAYGPGNSQLDHTPGERLSLAEYLQAVAVTDRAVHLLGARP